MVVQCRIAYASVYVDLATYFANLDDYKGKQGYLLQTDTGNFSIEEEITVNDIQYIAGFILKPQRNLNGRCYLVLAGMMIDTSMTTLEQNTFFFG